VANITAADITAKEETKVTKEDIAEIRERGVAAARDVEDYALFTNAKDREKAIIFMQEELRTLDALEYALERLHGVCGCCVHLSEPLNDDASPCFEYDGTALPPRCEHWEFDG
jgi:hypothetical protein